jgi:hypothetical protein
MAGVAVALAVGAIGCGGSGRLSRSEFTAKANGICGKYDAKIKAAMANVTNDPASIARGVDKTIPLIQQAQDEFAKLDPPKALDANWKEWQGINDDEIATAKQLSAAAKKNDKASFDSALAKLDSQDKNSTRLAKQMGLSTCAESS